MQRLRGYFDVAIMAGDTRVESLRPTWRDLLLWPQVSTLILFGFMMILRERPSRCGTIKVHKKNKTGPAAIGIPKQRARCVVTLLNQKGNQHLQTHTRAVFFPRHSTKFSSKKTEGFVFFLNEENDCTQRLTHFHRRHGGIGTSIPGCRSPFFTPSSHPLDLFPPHESR